MQKIPIQFKTPLFRYQCKRWHQDDEIPFKILQGMHKINFGTLARRATKIQEVENHHLLH